MASEKQDKSLTAILARLRQESGVSAPAATEAPSLDALHAHLVKLTRLVSSSPSSATPLGTSAGDRLKATLAKLQSIIDGVES
jgi:hypothetical protein